MLSGEFFLSENKTEWEKGYNNVEEQLLNIENKSPENFIDEVKLKYLRKYLPKSGIILEIGAGSGRLITRIGLENSEYKIIGLDYIKNSTKIIKNNITKYNLNGTSICGDIFKLPFKDNSIDTVVSGGLLEHFNDDEIPSVMMEMQRILKSGGLLYAEIVSKKFSLCRPIILTDAGGYENNFNKQRWYEIFNRNRFNDISVVSGLVIPPNFYGWFRSGFLLEKTYKLKCLVEYLDNTVISDIFGFSYYVIAYKKE